LKNIGKLFLLFIITNPLIGIAQTATITGTITNAENKPSENTDLFIKENKEIKTTTDANGYFILKVPAEKKQTLIISKSTFQIIYKKVNLKNEEKQILNFSLKNDEPKYLKEFKITKARNIRNVGVITEIKVKSEMVNVGGNLENNLKFQGVGVYGNNELSSSYAVRGGSFDENLVYVNDFEIIRPFLIRSGQQEGLSFANPNLVSNVKFSSGGFIPRYGDKMSSVLDISYKKPDKWKATGELSLMGANISIEGADKSRNTTFLLGARYKSSRYILSSLDVQGQYNPSFIDLQSYITRKISEKTSIEWLTNYAQNSYYLEPQNQDTRFGLINYTINFHVDYQGNENDKYKNFMSGLSLVHIPNDQSLWKIQISNYRSLENEVYDIIGQFKLGEVETDVSKPNFSEVKSLLGFGTFHKWARNQLESNIYNVSAKFIRNYNKHTVSIGSTWKFENIKDRLSEWTLNDSAGYSVPLDHSTMKLSSVLKSNNEINSQRAEGFVQDAWKFGSDTTPAWGFTFGVRYNYWYLNKELLISPRAQLYWMPLASHNWVLSASTGLYQQPPFFRELRDPHGVIHPDVKAQKSIHYILGSDYSYKIGDKPFKFTTEVYYKHMWDVNPYDYQNVLIRYAAKNNAIAYATGIDFRLQGELVKGAESWINLSFMQTKENNGYILTKYVDDTGDVYNSPLYTSRAIVDSYQVARGFYSRPTDQFFSFNLFYQDFIPNHPQYKVHLNLSYASGLPYSIPNNEAFRNFSTLDAYKRVDIGFSAMLYDINKRKIKIESQKFKHLKSIWATLEVFNLLGIKNEVSKDYVKDYSNRIFAIPNYLTSRRINFRVVFKF
jgi:hypothetical protein